MKAIGILIVLGVVVLPVCIWSGAVGSSQDSGDDDVLVSRASDGRGDVITAGRNLKFQNPIEGDLAVAGSNVTVAETVGGYVLAAGASVSVDASVGNDLWAAGSSVSVSAPVADNARLAGNSVVLQPSASVGGDAYLAGNSVEVLGPVEHDLKIGAAEARLGSEVGGSVRVDAGSVTLLPGAVVHGDLIVTSPQPPEISPDAQVLGRVVYRIPVAAEGWSPLIWLAWWTFIFLAILVLGVAAIALSGRWAERTAGEIAHRFGYSLLAGILGLIVVPLICSILAISLIGIPLAIVLFALYCVALLLSGVFVSYLVGGWVMGRLRRVDSSRFARLAAGALVVAFFCSLPWIGWIIQMLVLVTGFGALILERKDSWQRPHAESFA